MKAHLILYLLLNLLSCVVLQDPDSEVIQEDSSDDTMEVPVASGEEEISLPMANESEEVASDDDKSNGTEIEAPQLSNRTNLYRGTIRAPTFLEVATGIYHSDSAEIELSVFPFSMGKGDKDRRKFTCTPRNNTENDTIEVQLVNSTSLLTLLGGKNESQGICAVVLFYAPWCMFCTRIAPHFNALARVFPQLQVLAIDAIHFSSLNTRFGTIAVPNILIFHNSKAVARFNNSERTLTTMKEFVANVTGLKPNETIELTDEDYIGPLQSTPSTDPDYLLWLSWIFMVIFCSTMFIKSTAGRSVWNFLVSFGAEHHQHID